MITVLELDPSWSVSTGLLLLLLVCGCSSSLEMVELQSDPTVITDSGRSAVNSSVFTQPLASLLICRYIYSPSLLAPGLSLSVSAVSGSVLALTLPWLLL